MRTPPLPLLVTGLAGVAGYNAFHFFRQRFGDAVIGIRRANNWPLSGPGMIACDIEDAAAIRDLWQHHRFRSVVHCAGTCRLKSCQLDPAMAHRVNVVGTTHVARLAAEAEARLIHLSIDLVFAGRAGGGYREEDPPDPVTVYGETMVQAEELVASTVPGACVLRISLPMGISFNGHAGAIDWIGSRFKKGRPATLYYDEIRTPTYTDCLNPLLHRLLIEPHAGLFHAGGPRRLSLFQIAQIVNRVGGYEPHLLHGCPRIDAGPMPPRAGDVSLDSSKLQSVLGISPLDPWPLEEHWVPNDRSWHQRRAVDERGSARRVHQLLYQNARRPGVTPLSRDQLMQS